jgi:hypothetical protein
MKRSRLANRSRNRVSAFGRGVNNVFPAVGDFGARHFADAQIALFDNPHQLNEKIGRQGPRLQVLGAVPQCLAVTKNLFGGMVEFGRVRIGGLVKLVGGGHDVFDFRGQARFLQDDGIEQDGLIGDGVAGAFQFGQFPVGGNGLL